MILAVVDWDKILEVIWVSFAAGLGAVTIFSVVVYGSSRAGEARRAGGSPAAYGLTATFGLLLFAALIVFAVYTILNK